MIRLLAVCLLFVGSALTHMPVIAATSTSEELSAFKELQQSKWEAQRDLQQKDTEALRQQIAAVDKRVDDQLTQVGQGVDRFGVVISAIGTGITVLLVFVGFFGYRNAKTEAKEVATIEAKSSAEEWFKSKTESLIEQIAELERKAAHAQVQINARVQGLVAHADTRTAEIDAALRQVQGSIGDPNLKSTPAQEEANKTLAERDQELKGTNEDSYSFDDWDTRAHAAYSASKLDEAAYFWLKAAGVPNAGAANVARVLLNRGITQAELKQYESAIATYDDVLRRFSEAIEPALREQVAAALVSKGSAQVRLEQHESAIDTYDDLLCRFSEATEPALREQVAVALVNKGNAQGRLEQHNTAIDTYDDLLRRFGGATELALRERVARAMLNKGITQAELKQYESAFATYDEVLSRFGEATESALVEQIARALVNKGVTQSELKQYESAIATYDDVSRRFGDATESALRKQVTIALNGAGFARLIWAKILGPSTPNGQDTLRIALKNLNDAASRSTEPDGMVLGNRSYVQCLLGQTVSAVSDLVSALHAPLNGGQFIYEATLKDLEISPVSEDATMLALLDRAWLDFNGKGGHTGNTLSKE